MVEGIGGIVFLILLITGGHVTNSGVTGESAAAEMIGVHFVALITFSVLMIVGTMRGKPLLIVPWLVQSVLIQLLAFIFLIQFAFSLGVVIGGTLGTVINMYLWFVPYSYHIEIQEQHHSTSRRRFVA